MRTHEAGPEPIVTPETLRPAAGYGRALQELQHGSCVAEHRGGNG